MQSKSLRELREMCEGKGLDCSSCLIKRDTCSPAAPARQPHAAREGQQVVPGRQVDREQLRRSLRAKMSKGRAKADAGTDE